jgi:ankyrin repeat protein
MAAQAGHVDVIQVLVEAHANVDQATSDFGCTPLFASAQNDFIDVVRVLLEAHATVDQALTTNGRTPLYMAAVKGHVDVIKLLLNAGANAHATDSDGKTPPQAALEFNNSDAVAALRAAETAPLLSALCDDTRSTVCNAVATCRTRAA